MTQEITAYLEERFGISKSLFKDFRRYSDQKGRILLGPKNVPVPELATSIGLQIASVNGAIKPSTNFLQLFGNHATKSIVHLNKEQTRVYLKGEDLELSGKINATEGYVLLKYLDFPVACGLLKGNRIKNVLAKPRRTDLKFL